MAIEIRPYKLDDRDAVLRAVSVVYGNGSPPDPEDELPTQRSHVVAMDGDDCVGFYAEHHFDTWRGQATLATGGIAMVGVTPERRHIGVGGDLMRFSLRDMRSRGKLLASLYPFAESFYRQFGYEVCGACYRFEVPKSYLPRFAPLLPIRRLAWSEYDQIKPCYQAFARSRSGLTNRTDHLWDRLFGRKQAKEGSVYEKTVYAAGNPVEAYVVISHAVDFHAEQNVAEFAWCTSDGYDTMHSFLRSLAANKSGLRWFEPSDTPFRYRYTSSSALGKATLDHVIMYRILNVPGALQALKPTVDVQFSIEVGDVDIPENRGPWLVTGKRGTVTVEPTSHAELSCDIRTFTQAFLGQPGIDDVVRNGQMHVRSLAAVDAFRALLPPAPVYCLDFF